MAESNEALVRRRTFWGEGAWESLSGWLLKSFDPQAPLWVPDLSGEVRAAVQDAEVGSAASLVEVTSREWLDRNDCPVMTRRNSAGCMRKWRRCSE